MQIAALIFTADSAPRQLLSVHACDSLLCTGTPIMCHINDHEPQTPHRPIKSHLRRNILSGIEHSMHVVQEAIGSAHSSRALLSIALYPSGAAESLCWYLTDTPSVISLSLSCPLVQTTRSSSQFTENNSPNNIRIGCSWH